MGQNPVRWGATADLLSQIKVSNNQKCMGGTSVPPMHASHIAAGNPIYAGVWIRQTR
jgi:hypothetical protein